MSVLFHKIRYLSESIEAFTLRGALQRVLLEEWDYFAQDISLRKRCVTITLTVIGPYLLLEVHLSTSQCILQSFQQLTILCLHLHVKMHLDTDS